MYDLPELDAVHDALWGRVRAALAHPLGAAPAALTHRPRLPAAWLDAGLVVGQTCGWPLVHELRGRVTLLGTFRYQVPTAEGATYRSRLLVRRGAGGATAGTARAAVNDRNSLSGWVSLVVALGRDGRWPGPVVVTGSHLGSLHALADGRADVASVDAVTYALAQRHRAALVARIEVIGDGPRVPCLPLITGAGRDDADVAALRRALRAAVTGPDAAAVREALFVEDFVPLGLDDYDATLGHLATVVDPRS